MGKRFVELTTPASDGTGGGAIPGYTPETISEGRQIVTTAGTAVQLASSLVIGEVIIVAEFDNTGVIVVGGSGVIADEATRVGIPLNPCDATIIPINNINKIYIDSTIDTDGVTYAVVK